MARLRLALVVQAIDKATAPLRKIRQAVSRVGRATGLARVGTALGGVGRGLYRVGGEAARFGRRFGTVMALAAGAIGGLLTVFATKGDRIAKLADRIGIDIEELQKLQYAFDIGGTGAQQSGKALEYFTRSIGDAARGSGEAKQIFEAMGISIYDQQGNIKPTKDLLYGVADAMAKQPSSAKKAIAAQYLFGRSGQSLINTLSTGSKAMKDLGTEAVNLGVITAQQARDSESFIDSFVRAKQAVTGLTGAIAGELLPILTPLIERFAKWLATMKPAVVHEMTLFLSDMAGTVGWLANTWGRATEMGRQFLDWLIETVPPIRGWIDMGRDWERQTSWITIAVGVLTLFLARGLIVAIIALFAPLAKLGLALLLAGGRMLWLAARGVWVLAVGLGTVLVTAIGYAVKGMKLLTAVMLRNPFVALAVGIGLAAWWVIKHWDEIWQASKDAWTRVKAVFDLTAWNIELSQFSLLLVVSAWFSGVYEVAAIAWRDIRNAIDVDAWKAALESFDLWGTGRRWVGDLWEGVIAGWDGLFGWIRRKAAQLGEVLPDWLRGAFGIGGSAPAPSAGATPGATIPSALGGGAQETRVGGEVRIRFDNAPPGTRITAVRSDNPDVPLDVTAGLVLAPAT